MCTAGVFAKNGKVLYLYIPKQMFMFRRIIPFVAALVIACSCCSDRVAKVDYKVWYDWPERQLPADFDALGTPDVQGTKINIDLVDIVDTVNHFAVLFETEFKVNKAEEYTFKLASDDGSKLYIDGELVIVNDGAHGPILKTVTRQMAKGRHPLRLEFFDFDKGQMLNFTYHTPTIAEREFNDQIQKQEDRLSDNDKFVKPQVEEALKRYKAWKGEDETLVFPILTDVHTAGRFTYKHIGLGVRAAEAFEADFMANLGDIGLNAYPATIDPDYAQLIIRNTREQMDKYDGVWLYTPGNHDWDAGDGTLFTEDFLSDTFQKPYEPKAGGNLHLTPGRTYGYYDIPEKQVRVVFLNSQATRTIGDYYIYGDEQLGWLKNLLESTPAQTSVLVMSHLMPHPFGVWSNTVPAQSRIESCRALMGILEGYAPGHSLVGMVCGDAHVNFNLVENGVNYYVSQGYGWVSPDLMLPVQTHAFFDYRETLCIDVVAVKPAKREVHTFRIGAGGAAFDSAFNY